MTSTRLTDRRNSNRWKIQKTANINKRTGFRFQPCTHTLAKSFDIYANYTTFEFNFRSRKNGVSLALGSFIHLMPADGCRNNTIFIVLCVCVCKYIYGRMHAFVNQYSCTYSNRLKRNPCNKFESVACADFNFGFCVSGVFEKWAL